VAAGAQVINMSLGGPVYSPAEHDAVKRARAAGVVLVAAAGNHASREVHYPAGHPEVIAVTSVTGPNGKCADYSARGNWTDVGAETTPYFYTRDGVVVRGARGTSLTSPAIAGLVGRLVGADVDPDTVYRTVSHAGTGQCSGVDAARWWTRIVR
jgi:subtilisin family serine protease